MLKPKEKPQKPVEENEDSNQKGEREMFKILNWQRLVVTGAGGESPWSQQLASLSYLPAPENSLLGDRSTQAVGAVTLKRAGTEGCR